MMDQRSSRYRSVFSFLQLKQLLKKNRTIRRVLSKYYYKKVPLRRVSYGDENPNVTFYIIGRENTVGGAWALINTVMMHLCICDEHGFIPIVDMKNFKTQYTEEDEFKKVNLWEKFFFQPSGFSLEDIQRSRNVIISSTASVPSAKYSTYAGSDIWKNSSKLSLFKEIFSKYIKFNDAAKSYLEEQVNRCFQGKKHVIGVLCRGTDFLVNKPSGNYVQPGPEIVLNDVKQEFCKGTYDAVFLATEDQDIQDLFENEFGQSLLFIDQVRVSKKDMRGDAWIASVREKLNPKEDKYIAFLSYFSATYILSKCECLFAGKNNGSKGVLFMSSNFKFTKIYDCGLY